MMDSTNIDDEQQSAGETDSNPVVRVAIGIAVLVAIVLLGRVLGGYVEPFAQWVDGLGFWGPVAFIAAYAVAVVAFVPAALLTLGAGAIFGIAKGVVFVFIAAVLGSAASFLIARYGARGIVERRLAGNKKIDAIDRAIAAEGRKIVFLLRLVPVVPFNAINYALGLTRVSLADYMIASVGMLPGTLLYVYSGKLAGDVAGLASGSAVSQGIAYYALIGLGFAATIAVTVVVTRIARKALDEATGD